MVTVIKKGTPLKKITEKLQKLSDKKRAGFNAKKYLGRIKKGLNPVEYQRKLRDEWQ